MNYYDSELQRLQSEIMEKVNEMMDERLKTFEDDQKPEKKTKK